MLTDSPTNPRRVALLFALASALTGCNPRYCEDHPDRDCDKPIDANGETAGGCTSNGQCTAASAMICDVSGSMTCVQCTASEASACTGTTPSCGPDHVCRGCTTHSECASNACLPDGSCGDDSKVAYVDPTGTDNATCTKATPCTKVAKALATLHPFVKFHGSTNEQVSINNQSVTLLADPAAQLTSTSNGILLEVRGSSVVAIFDLALSGASGSSGFGISMPTGNAATLTLTRATVANNVAGGISASGGVLNVERSTVSGNSGGGISVSGTSFAITNSVVASNGGATSGLGGIKIDGITTPGTYKLLFNTLTANGGPATVNTGITCGTVLMPVTLSNNIVYGNVVAGGGKQIGGSVNCSPTYSDVGPDSSAGTGNINTDPVFVNAAVGNVHLMPASPCKDAADPAATMNVDIDGDTRPQGTGRDIGADEVKP